MTDSRTRQMAALIDDARTIAADMGEEGLATNRLAALAWSLRVSLRHIELLEAELARDGVA